jgi:hypothetical protein
MYQPRIAQTKDRLREPVYAVLRKISPEMEGRAVPAISDWVRTHEGLEKARVQILLPLIREFFRERDKLHGKIRTVEFEGQQYEVHLDGRVWAVFPHGSYTGEGKDTKTETRREIRTAGYKISKIRALASLQTPTVGR